MTAVASPPTFAQPNRSAWGTAVNGGHSSPMNQDELNRMFLPRKSLQRSNSSSSVSSATSNSSTSTVVSTAPSQPNGSGSAPSAVPDLQFWSDPVANGPRKRPQQKSAWSSGRPESSVDHSDPRSRRPPVANGANGSMHAPSPMLSSHGQPSNTQQNISRPLNDSSTPGSQPALYLLPLNGTFERKTISVPYSPDTLRIGRQTNNKTLPTPINGFFDSKVLSRQHAEVWADRQSKIWIRDVKSSNGTFVNGTRLSPENRESEPHELQTGDHLELGIDIVSEDQKTVVHHKVAAKVEHAGLLSQPNNLLDMNFGDLDPSNGSMMMSQQGGVPYRGRNGNQGPVVANGRQAAPGPMNGGPQANGMGHMRGFFFSPISTEQIVKKLQNEMRTARLQSQDLSRTGSFVDALLTKQDVKDMEKPEVSDPSKSQSSMVNGNGISFRGDAKTRFSDPPAPPPQQPLPEKPDVPSLRRGPTERAKSSPQSVSPIRQDGSVSQIVQLTEALTTAKKEIESQTSRMRHLEEMLQKEREARELAEELARRLEEDTGAKTDETAEKPTLDTNALEAAFDPPAELTGSPQVETPKSEVGMPLPASANIEPSATNLQAQIESMMMEMSDLRQQLDAYKKRAETAETERDVDRKSLAEMALQIREQNEARDAVEKARSQADDRSENSDGSSTLIRTPSSGSSAGQKALANEPLGPPTLSRANTIRPGPPQSAMLKHEKVLYASLPYASMVSVVIIGMGLMVYINGWPNPPRVER